MHYVELLRARRVLIWFGGIIFTMLALGLALVYKEGGPHLQMSGDRNPMIPFDYILAGAAFAPLVIAAFLGVGLDAEYKTTAISWTRPMSRLAIAARYVAIDFGAMIVAWVLAVIACLVPIFLLGLNRYYVFGTDGFLIIGLAFGCAIMWYGLIVLFSAFFPGRGNVVVGLSWAYALIVPGLAQIPFPHLLRQAVIALNYINPLAYLNGIGSGKASLIVGSPTAHMIAAWLIGIAALAIGTQLWARRDVPA
jgi:hypothetical protein